MAARQRCFGPPVDTLQRLPLSAAVGGSASIVASAVGRWSGCDVWLNAPGNWADVRAELHAFVGTHAAAVAIAATIGAALDRPLIRSGRLEARLFRVRGVAADQFALQLSPNATNHLEAVITLSCWGQDGALAGDAQGRPVVDAFAPPERWRAFPGVGGAVPPVALAPGGPATIALTAEGEARAVVTGWRVASRIDALPRLVSLQHVIAGVPSTVDELITIPTGGVVSAVLGSPIRSDRDGVFQVLLEAGAGAGAHFASVQGYLT